MNTETLKKFFAKIEVGDTQQVLVRIHSAIHTKEEMGELVGCIKELQPGAHITGCSAMQVIMEGKLIPDTCLVSVSVFEDAEICSGHFSCLGEDGGWRKGKEIGEELVRKISDYNQGFMLVFFPVAYPKIEEFVETVNGSSLSVRMLGGAANKVDEEGNLRTDLAYVVEDEGASSSDMAFACIKASEFYVYGDYVCGFEAVGKQCRIKSSGQYIDKVDNMSGAEWYSSLLGEDNLNGNPDLAHVFPVIRRNGKGIAYYVDYVQEKGRYCLKSFGELKDGSEISLGYFHPQKIFEQVKNVMKNVGREPAESIFAYDCESRMNLLHNCGRWENENFGNTNISGALLSGEISSKDGENLYANYTFVIAALSEHRDAHFMLGTLDMGNVQELQEDNVQILNYLLLNAHKHLSEELIEQRAKMQDAVFYNTVMDLDNQLKYPFDRERKGLDKVAALTLNNEKMFRLFSGVTKTYQFLKDCYHRACGKFLREGLYFYSYNDTSLLVAADSQISPEDFVALVDELHAYLSSFACEEISLSYTAAILLDSGDNPLQRLESALHYAKTHKLTRIRFDEIGDDLNKEQEDIHMLWVVREALLHRRVTPFFQEIHNNSGGSKRMFESLMRLYDKDGNIYYPDRFLPIAKEYDLYESLSELMVSTVIEMFRDKDIRVTINLNVQDIYNRDMIRIIFDKMKAVPHPENFVFEIVESEEITDYEYIKQFANRIHEAGGKVAIDDFGSGFSNLLHIINIEADYIKVDGEVVRFITTDTHCRDFVEFINGWCEKAGQEVICEYIENEQIQNIMEEIGVRYSQGYYFSKPHRWGPEDEA